MYVSWGDVSPRVSRTDALLIFFKWLKVTMFDNLSDKFNSIFDGLTKRGALSKKDVEAALREVRIALLEADVALDVVKKFIESVKQRAIGEEVIRSVTPGQMVIKIVHDYLTEMLGGAGEDLTSRLETTGIN